MITHLLWILSNLRNTLSHCPGGVKNFNWGSPRSASKGNFHWGAPRSTGIRNFHWGVNLTIQISQGFTPVGHWGGTTAHRWATGVARSFQNFIEVGMITQIPIGVSPGAPRYTPVHPGAHRCTPVHPGWGNDTGCCENGFTRIFAVYAVYIFSQKFMFTWPVAPLL